ncbi:MAG TPA: hypothetical protein VGU69_10285 [Rhizomicrobium sp.]|nr:hypothetical protein [Rhizomicrobium sp.]
MNPSFLRQATGAIVAVACLATIALHWPGELSPDSVLQLLEGRLGQYNSWHPPVMAWMLGLGDAISPGAGLFIAFDAILAFGALASLLWLRPAGGGLVPLCIAAVLCLLPQFLLYQGIVWKDVLFADAMLAGFVCLAHATTGRHRLVLLASSLLLLSLAALARQNGAILLPFAAAAVIAGEWNTGRRRAIAWGVVWLALAGMITLAAGFVLDLRSSRDSGPGEQVELLQTYDLAGAAYRGVPLEYLRRKAPRLAHELETTGARLYTPQRNDPVAASDAITTAVERTKSAIIADQWRALILSHPALYLSLRADAFRWVFLTPDIVACRPLFAGIEGPADALKQLGLAARRDAKDRAFVAYGAAFMGTPVFSHLFWALAALAAFVFLIWRRRPADIVFACLIAGLLSFTASFFFISLACDYRYLYTLDLCTMAVLFYLATSRE